MFSRDETSGWFPSCSRYGPPDRAVLQLVLTLACWLRLLLDHQVGAVDLHITHGSKSSSPKSSAVPWSRVSKLSPPKPFIATWASEVGKHLSSIVLCNESTTCTFLAGNQTEIS